MKKTLPKRNSLRKRKSKKKYSVLAKWLGVLAVVLLIGVVGYHYRNGLAYYLGYKTDSMRKTEAEEKRLSDVRNFQILTKYKHKAAGIDVSEYQGKIVWDSMKNTETNFPISFVFIRATVGKDRPDAKFSENWEKAKQQNILRGAYHYYRPNENSLDQAALFIKTVKLQKGDFPPVLDIEQMPKNQPLDSLKVGLKRWLHKVEKHYGVKPIIYSGENFYNAVLKEEFAGYDFWIANYNFFAETIRDEWQFWQFTEKGTVSGIEGAVDINVFNGNLAALRQITIKK